MSTFSAVARAAAHGLIRFYQLTFSGLVGRQCRYAPTCSDYADEAIRRHGLWPGFWLALARLSRCHPLGGAGYDPVPDRLDSRGHWYVPWRYGVWHGPGDCEAKGLDR